MARPKRYDGDPQLILDLSKVNDTAIEAAWEVPATDASCRPTAELLATLLGPATLATCHRLLDALGGLRPLARVFPVDLKAQGLNRAHVEKLAALFDLAKRFGQEEFVPGAPFRGSYDIYAHFRERLVDEPREFFLAVLLDNKNRKLKDVTVSIGSLTSSIVHPREVYLPIIRESAAAVIFVHNHPSGDPTPSKEDLEITRRLREVGELIGIRVLDHVVIGKGRYVSFVDDGYW